MERRLLKAIVAALGGTAALGACGGKVTTFGSDTGGDDGSGGGGGLGGAGGYGSTGIVVGVGPSTTVGGTGGGACFDALLPPTNDPVPMDACTTQEDPYGYPYSVPQMRCFEVPEGESCDTAFAETCILDTYNCGFQQVGDAACGPYEVSGECCYVVLGHCPIGRPFHVGGVARRSVPVGRGDWVSQVFADLDLRPLTPQARAALADAWTEEALTEHASIASFSRFLLQLLALGAPAELVSEAQHAIADEQRHARTAFELASLFADEAVGPGPLDVSNALDGVDLVGIATSVASEGAIAETVSAAIVAEMATVARPGPLQRHLAEVAREEQAHAVLAWRFLAWAIAQDDAVREAVEQVFVRANEHVGIGPVVAHVDHELEAWGYLSPDRRREIARDALATVVLPARSALFRPATNAGAQVRASNPSC